MSFDDRLRDELRRAVESHPIDAEATLHGVKETRPPVAQPVPADAVVVALEDVDVPRRSHVRTQRIVGVAAAVALVAGGVAVPLALRDHAHDSAGRKPHRTVKNGENLKAPRPGNDRVALQAVAAAVDATTNSGSFRVAYTLTETPGTAPTTTVCQSGLNGPRGATASQTPVTECFSSGTNHNVTTTGAATVNVDPFAMVAVSNVSSFGNVTVQVDDTNYWETTGEGTAAASAPGSPISSFAGLVESTLGPREGASAMMGLASPTGYLSITRAAITGAAKLGTGTVNGEPVTNYRVTVDPALLADVPGLSAEEKTTIDAALRVMSAEGFSGNTTDVSVNAGGFVVHTASTDRYADGGTVYSEDTFSMFGCAGAVQIPGRPADPSAPTCAVTTTPTPTTGAGGVAGPTTTVVAGSTTTTAPAPATTTVPGGSVPGPQAPLTSSP